MTSAPWRPVPQSLLVDTRWLVLTLCERAVYLTLVLAADTGGVIVLPKSASAAMLVASLCQCTLVQAKKYVTRLVDVGLLTEASQSLQLDVLTLTQDSDRPATHAERQRAYRLRQIERDVERDVEVTKSDFLSDEKVTKSVTKSDEERDEKKSQKVTINKDREIEKDKEIEGNKEVEGVRTPSKRTTTRPDFNEILPLPGTAARQIYDAIVGSPTLHATVRAPIQFSKNVTEAWPKVDVLSEIRKAALWLGGLTESKRRRYKDGRAFLSNWLRRAQDDVIDSSGGYAKGPIKASTHDAFAAAKASPDKALVYDPAEVFGVVAS